MKLCFLIKLPEASSSRSVPPTAAPPYRYSAICGPKLRVTRKNSGTPLSSPTPPTPRRPRRGARRCWHFSRQTSPQKGRRSSSSCWTKPMTPAPIRRSAARRRRWWKRPCARVASMHLQGRQRLLAAALMLVSAGMAAAYGPMGVRVNAVNPGANTPSACNRECRPPPACSIFPRKKQWRKPRPWWFDAVAQAFHQALGLTGICGIILMLLAAPGARFSSKRRHRRSCG